METEVTNLLERLRVLDAALAHVQSTDGERPEVKDAIESVRAVSISKLRELGHDYDRDEAA